MSRVVVIGGGVSELVEENLWHAAERRTVVAEAARGRGGGGLGAPAIVRALVSRGTAHDIRDGFWAAGTADGERLE